MYDATAALTGTSVPAAVPAETATYGEVTAAVKKSAEYSNQNTIANTVARLVKQAGADTTIQNAARDNAEWAWIPSGDTCAFCIALASRGWQYASKKVMKGDHAQHIHANCDCTFAVRFDKKSSYDSYNPKKYEDIYNSAEGSSSKDKINSIRRELYKTNGDTIREQKRIAYAARKERTSGTVAKGVKDGIMGSDKLVGVEVNGTTVSEIGEHVLNRMTDRSVSVDTIQNALEHPLEIKPVKYDNQGRPSFTVVGEKATVSINPDTGKLTTTYPTHTKTAQKLKKQKEEQM